MFARKAVILSTLLAASAAFAQAPATTDAAATELEPAMSVMKPGNIDVRGMIETDILLIYVNLGGIAEMGLIPIGPGTLAVGAEIDYGFCGSACWVISGLTEINLGERYFTPMARASYHFTIPALKIAHKLDLFGSLGVGLTFASVNLDADDNSFTSSASSTALTIAPGIGANYFVNPNFFVGGELRYRIASGTYEYRFTGGNTTYVFNEDEQQWDLTGLGLNFFLGYRF